jgi:hypothetical protein
MYNNDEEVLQGLRSNRHDALKHVYKTVYPSVLSYIKNNSGSEDEAQDSPQLSRINCEILNLHCIIFIDILAVDKTIQKQTPGIQFSEIVPIDFTICFSIYFASPASEASQKIKVIMSLKFLSTCHSCYSHHS